MTNFKICHILVISVVLDTGATLLLTFTRDSSDEELVLSIQKGSEQAFDLLYKRYQGKLMGYLVHKMRNQELAEEVFQKTWIKVLDAIPRFKKEARFSSWLFTISTNLMKDWFKKNANRQKYLQTLRYAEESAVSENDGGLDLSFLSPRVQKIIECKYVMGMNSNEISREMNLTEANVRKIVSRAMKEIHLRLKTEGAL